MEDLINYKELLEQKRMFVMNNKNKALVVGHLPNSKKVCLSIREANTIEKIATFVNDDMAVKFLELMIGSKND